MKNVLDFYPLSPLQSGMLFHHVYSRGGDADLYVEQFTCSFEGDLNVTAFRRAWEAMIARHAVLRTYFVWEGLAQPVQVVLRNLPLDWQQEDWRGLPAEQCDRQWQHYLAADQRRGIDLGTPPLMRFFLVRTEPERYEFAWSHHHILLDGWSTQLLFKELFACYASYCEGGNPQLPSTRPYRDYIGWLHSQDQSAAETFWREQLKDFRVPTQLGQMRQRDKRHEHSNRGYREESMSLPSWLSESLRHMVRSHQLTLNTVLQGAWALVLSRCSGQTDVVFGGVTSGRPPEVDGVETMVGLFINTLPVRIHLDPETRVRDWLVDLQQAQAKVRQFEYSKLVDLQSWSDLPRGIPLFDSIFVFENYPASQISLAQSASVGSLQVNNLAQPGRTNYPLSVCVWLDGDLQMSLTYDLDQFEGDSEERMLSRLSRVLEQMTKDPGQRIGEIELLPQQEIQQVLLEWNATEQSYPRDRCLQELFEEQVARTPDSVAVLQEGKQLSYRELNKRANQLGAYLREVGVGPEVTVALCVEHSLEMVIAILGVLKAGGAYVPLEPEHPPEWRANILEDSLAPVLLTQQHLVDRKAHPKRGVRTICLDGDSPCWQQPATGDLKRLGSAENAAYIIYTSGSTGRPKGVVVTHASLVNYLSWCRNHYPVTQGSGSPVHTSAVFDLTITSLFSPLLCGKPTLVLKAHRENPAQPLADILGQQRPAEGFSLVKLTPAHLNLLTSETRMQGVRNSTACLVVGGEALSCGSVQAWQKWDPNTRIFNEYGPTEATVGCCVYEVDRNFVGRSVPIGRPIANTQVYVLDKFLEPVPIGVVGELYIGGAGLARGYLNRAELTAERFIAHPYSERGGERLYRTGDLGKWRGDGNLEFAGRVDDQVKVRGYRIEPGEIAAVLEEHGNVQQAVVMVEEVGEQKQLVAYVVVAAGAGGEAGEGAAGAGGGAKGRELRDYLRARLPEYMVPGRYVEVEKMPLTWNGKVDRKALVEMGREAGEARGEEGSYEGPRNATEELLAGIWGEVLGRERVGMDDNFFELGGHSLLATQVMSRVRATLGVELGLAVIFQQGTIAGLAEKVEEAREERSGVRLPAMGRVSREGELPLSFAQQRLWFMDQLEPGNPAYNIAAGVRIEGAVDGEALRRALREVGRRHEVLRTHFGSVEGRAVQYIAADIGEVLEEEDLREVGEERRAEVLQQRIKEESEKGFDLREGPLWRARLLRMGTEEQVLLLILHHIVSDAWSMEIVIGEVASLYGAFREGKASPLPELGIQYVDYAVWQREWLQGEAIEQALGYWKRQLNGAAVLEMPTDWRRPVVRSHRGGSEKIELSGELTRKLREMSRRAGATLYMTLLAAFQVVLGRWAGQEDVVVGSPIANRNRKEIEPLIGFFVNQVVMRTDLGGDPTFQELVARVREVALAGYTHQDVPFERVVEELGGERDLSRTPVFQVMFAMESGGGKSISTPGVVLQPLAMEANSIKYDLALVLQEGEATLSGALQYSRDLYEGTTVGRMVKHLERVLEQVVEHPEKRIGELELLSEEEREQVVRGWNRTEVNYPEQRCIHELFEEQVERAPEALAVVHEGRQLSYGELNARANRVAQALRELGVGAEVRVGLYVERSVEMVVGILGILKAGGAYVPMDPEYPGERIAYMIEDAGLPVVLTQRRLRERLPANWMQVLILDEEEDNREAAARQSETDSRVEPSGVVSENAAYVIYTSGSTGRPKGVVVTHRAVGRLVFGAKYISFGPDQVFLQLAPISFDASVLEIWGALLHGGRCVLSGEQFLSASQLAEILKVNRVSVLWLTSTLFNSYVDENIEALPLSLQLLVGGEALSVSHVMRVANKNVGMKIVNGYGPTESTTFTACYEIRGSENCLPSMPIGRPIANTQVYVLDKFLEPVPIGVVGELYIGGAGLARGYLNRAELTAERFIAHPYSERGGERLYRTGDLGKWRGDGNLEFVGRVDDQVKVRGYRIEPGEIAAVLEEHGNVQQAVVMVEEVGEQKQLVAYVVVAAGAGGAAGEGAAGAAGAAGEAGGVGGAKGRELRDYLRARLPEYMVPGRYVEVEKMPLTWNGKVDRKALVEMGREAEEARGEEGSYEGPRNATEELLAGIWAEVLGRERVGIDDNFFELGGDSIRSIQICARAAKVGFLLSVQDLFRYQTIRDLVRNMGPQSCSEPKQFLARFDLLSEQDRQRLSSSGLEDAYPLTRLQEGMLFHTEYSPDIPIYHDVHSFHLRMHFSESLLKRVLQRVVERHEILRTSFDLGAFSEPLQLVHKEITLPLDIVDIRDLGEAEQTERVEDLIQREKNRHFDWQNAPLFRFVICLRHDDSVQFTFSHHHAILDGWSVASLLTELIDHYSLALEGTVGRDSIEPGSMFRDFVAYERKQLQSQEARSFWLNKLRGVGSLEIATRSGEPSNPQARVLLIAVPDEMRVKLQEFARTLEVPVKTLCLAAHLRVLALLDSSSDIVTGVAVNGRPEETGAERAIGLFLNTVPFRIMLRRTSWRQFVKEVFEAETEILPFRSYPFSELQRLLNGKRLFQTAFTFNHFHIYRALQHMDAVSVLGGTSFEQTECAWAAVFTVNPFTSEIVLNLEYNDGIDQSWIENAGGYYLRAFSAMTEMPDSVIDASHFLPWEERIRLLREWSGPGAEDVETKSVQELFEQQVERTPESIAVEHQGEQMSYREANRQSNQLAHHLRELGVGPEARVALYLERSPAMIVGILGILKAGGAYVPIDPEYPAERVSYILKDAQVEAIVTEQRWRARLQPAQAQIICMDLDAGRLRTKSEQAPTSGVAPNNAAYVIYTSGSTGHPKGVVVQHGSLSNLARAQCRAFGIDAKSRVLQAVSVSFDAAISDWATTLITGATLILAPHQVLRSIPDLITILRDSRITTAALPSAVLALLPKVAFPDLQTIITGGQFFSAELCTQWATEHAFFDVYGATEAAVATTFNKVTTNDRNVGRPIANTQVYVLDKFLEPVPIGVVGELYIGGAGLARGYLNQAELTAERFIAHPYSERGGERLYRTGDLGKWRGDGNLEFVGRVDDQVKVRGYRIEPGEIAAVLEEHGNVQQAVVMVEEVGEQKQLVAYVVVAAGTAGGEAGEGAAGAGGGAKGRELRDYLRARLPEYMVPGRYVEVEKMPLTWNGKVDRKALVEMGREAEEARGEEGSYEGPRNATEELLAGIWGEVLGRERVGIDDNFFELGGDSITATQVVARVRKNLGAPIELRSLFQSQSLAVFAQGVQSLLDSKQLNKDFDELASQIGDLPPEEVQRLLLS